jgi:hypothetical protein
VIVALGENSVATGSGPASTSGASGPQAPISVVFAADPADVAATQEMAMQESGDSVTAVGQSKGRWVAAAVPGPASLVPAVSAAVLASVLAGLGGVFLGRRLSRRDSRRESPRATGVLAATVEHEPDHELKQLRACWQHRSVLVRRLAELLPQMPDSLAWQVSNALAEAGVQPFSADGEPFDPDFHHAVGTEPTATPDRENTIARTIRPGYRDGQQILVYPKVVVYAVAEDRRTP